MRFIFRLFNDNFEVFTVRYTRQHPILITSRYGRSFLDLGRETVGNSAAPSIVKSAVTVGLRPHRGIRLAPGELRGIKEL